MKRKIRLIIWLALTVALVVIAVKAPRVSADEEPTRSTATVTLTAAQTLALYGQSFPALYYDGNNVQNVTFEFAKSSRTVCDELNSCFTNWSYNNSSYSVLPSNAQNAFTMYIADEVNNLSPATSIFNQQLWSNSSWIGVDNGSAVDREKIIDFEFLMYKCSGVSPRPVNSSTYDFQFNIQFPFIISGVERFQSLYMLQIGMFTPHNCFDTSPTISNGNLRSEVRLYGNNNLVPLDVTTDAHLTGYNNYFGLAFHPINTCNYNASGFSSAVPTFGLIDRWLSSFGIFSLSMLDSTVSNQDLFGINWNIRAGDAQANFLRQNFDPLYSDVQDPNSSNYQYEDSGIYIMVMCPIIQGDFTIGRPSGSGSYIDYTESLDKLISGSDATNNKLDIIIQKLDRIYNQMVSDNGGVDLIAPETIGFTQQQKQQILTGVNGMNGEMSEITPADFDDEAETVSGFWDVWENILDIFPPKLLFLYTFALVAGAVSWVIFSRRG